MPCAKNLAVVRSRFLRAPACVGLVDAAPRVLWIGVVAPIGGSQSASVAHWTPVLFLVDVSEHADGERPRTGAGPKVP